MKRHLEDIKDWIGWICLICILYAVFGSNQNHFLIGIGLALASIVVFAIVVKSDKE